MTQRIELAADRRGVVSAEDPMGVGHGYPNVCHGHATGAWSARRRSGITLGQAVDDVMRRTWVVDRSEQVGAQASALQPARHAATSLALVPARAGASAL